MDTLHFDLSHPLGDFKPLNAVNTTAPRRFRLRATMTRRSATATAVRSRLISPRFSRTLTRMSTIPRPTILPAPTNTLRSHWRRELRPSTVSVSGSSTRSASTTPCRPRIFTSGRGFASTSSATTTRAGRTATVTTSATGKSGTSRTLTRTTPPTSGHGAGRKRSSSSFTKSLRSI